VDFGRYKIVENERNLIAVKSVRVERTSIKFGLEALALGLIRRGFDIESITHLSERIAVTIEFRCTSPNVLKPVVSFSEARDLRLDEFVFLNMSINFGYALDSQMEYY